MPTSLREKALRVAFRLPGYVHVVERALGGQSEVTLPEARFLGELVKRAPSNRPIIEIGTLFGASTRVIAMFKANETPLITVDSFRWNPYGLTSKQHATITKRALREAFSECNVHLHELDKREFYKAYDGPPPGLVFLDANHSYPSTLEDISWARAVNTTIVCGHDFTTRHPGVMRAVAECGGAAEVVGTLFALNALPE